MHKSHKSLKNPIHCPIYTLLHVHTPQSIPSAMCTLPSLYPPPCMPYFTQASRCPHHHQPIPSSDYSPPHQSTTPHTCTLYPYRLHASHFHVVFINSPHNSHHPTSTPPCQLTTVIACILDRLQLYPLYHHPYRYERLTSSPTTEGGGGHLDVM